MAVVPAHTLTFPNPEDELALLELLSENAVDNIANSPINLGSYFDDSLRMLGFRCFLEYPQEDIIQTLRKANLYGKNLFYRGQFNREEIVTITFDEQSIDIKGGTNEYHTALRWLTAYGIALVLRDQSSINQLVQFNPFNFEGEYDEYWVTMVEIIIASTQNPKTVSDTEHLFQKIHNATLFPERAQILSMPLAELLVLSLSSCSDKNTVNNLIAKALQGHHSIGSQPEESHLADNYIPCLLLGLCAQLHDSGVEIDIISPYIPEFLVNGF